MRSAFALVAMLVLAGCGGGGGDRDDAPAPVSTVTVTATTSPPTPIATPTDVPSANLVAWAAGSNRLLRSDDGGFTWEPDAVVAVGDAVDFVNADVGWVAGSTGSGGTLLHTIDGGRTWSAEAADLGDPPPFFFDVDAADTAHAVIAGSENRLTDPFFHRGPPAMFFTDDAGASWRRSELVGLDLLRLGEVEMLSVCVTAAGHGIAVGGDAVTFIRTLVIVTHDAGATWREISDPPPTSFGAEVACTGERDFWIADTRTGLFQSPDGGETWRTRSPDIPNTPPLLALRFETPLDGRVVGFGNNRLVVYHTRDGGEQWASTELPTSTGLIEVAVGIDFRGDDGVIVLQDLHPLQIPRSSFGVAFATGDGGASWTETVFPEPINALWDVALVPPSP